MSELDLDAIERRANKQRATDEDLLDLTAEVRHLRAAVDAALVICAEYTETPPPAKPEPCDDACDGYCHHDARFATAARIRDALAPVADPDPHTTSDEETT
jgi:hypothetical protein